MLLLSSRRWPRRRNQFKLWRQRRRHNRTRWGPDPQLTDDAHQRVSLWRGQRDAKSYRAQTVIRENIAEDSVRTIVHPAPGAVEAEFGVRWALEAR
jgi:hypothetical protein